MQSERAEARGSISGGVLPVTEITFGKRLRYSFDNLTSRGPAAMIGMLFVLAVFLISLISVFVIATGVDPEGRGFIEVAWSGLMRTLDAGTMGGDTGPVPFLLAMLAVTIGGIFVVGTLIGIITTGIDSKLEQLRKGKSFVAEENHTVILGWSPQIFTVVSEIVTANENRKHACIAVLAEKDKVEMEDEIRAHVPDTKTTRVVCRTGCPIDLGDLEIINHHGARAIVVLPPDDGDPDSSVIKTVLALVNNPNRRREPYHIVGVIDDPDNLEVAEMVGRSEAQLVLAGDMIARISAQTCRQSGLSIVYTELLDFGGDEIYFAEEPALIGRSFGESLMMYEDSSVIGICRADGTALVNPPMDTVYEKGDRVIAISEDDDTVRLSGITAPPVRRDLVKNEPPHAPGPERTLILGWNRRVPIVVRELDGYVSAGSTVTLVADPESENALASVASGPFRNITVAWASGSTTDRDVLEGLDVPSFDHVIVHSYSDTMSTQQADARTLITLLHLRNIRERSGRSFSIVSEMLDDRNRQLAEVTRADDFIVSDKLISLMIAQIAENPGLKGLFRDLFDPEGSEVYLKPVEGYVATGTPLDFYTVVESARMKREVALGYRILSKAHDPGSAHGVVVNPYKSRQITFQPGDRIIVLGEN
ncbi:potassium transporter TrkA [Candidatus Fermentibacteria bacterium]|nr:potassium transporter TrkA [Candidatus Fermentibacteria bacterium]